MYHGPWRLLICALIGSKCDIDCLVILGPMPYSPSTIDPRVQTQAKKLYSMINAYDTIYMSVSHPNPH
jgi:hypothetical protein